MKKITTLLTILVLALAMNITVLAANTNNSTTETEDELFAFSKQNQIVHVLGETDGGNEKNFYTEFLKMVSAEKIVYMDCSNSMKTIFKKEAESIKNNFMPYLDETSGIKNVFESGSTTLYECLEQILLEEENQKKKVTMVTDLWDTTPKGNISGLPSTEIIFFVPYESKEIDGVKHCEETCLNMLNQYLPESSIYVVYLDKMVVKYTNIVIGDDYWGVTNYVQ